ncbi:MAG: DUF2934 domain-containing protein [Alphaproteobacteria bacterium]|nr:DUF2934 domain-containing protein [Alphaproteobacteria bacterium]
MKAKVDIRKQIEVRAYHIWESEGRPHGRSDEHWRRAEAEILANGKAKPRVRAKAAAPKGRKTKAVKS